MSQKAVQNMPIEAQPILGQRGRVIQSFGTLVQYPIALAEDVRASNVEMLNQILVDSITLRDMYKKHHWQVTGPTFYQLHLLFDKHFNEQNALIDLLGERVQILGGLALAMASDIVERTKIERPPACRDQVPVELSRLLEAHEIVIRQTRAGIELSARNGDWGTNDLLMSDVLRTNEKQVWFLSTHLVDTPLVRAKP